MQYRSRNKHEVPGVPYGVQYHRAPTPLPEEWADDLQEIAASGYTHIQLRPQWRWHERKRGQFEWADLDRLFELAQMHELRVILKPMLETAPDWVFADLKGTRIGFDGVPISPIAVGAYYVGGWWPDFDNPDVMAAALEFVRALVTRYRKHEALWLYNAWNEPRSRPVESNQSEHSIRAYRRWLEERFGSVEQLNERYGKRWTSFEYLRPPVTGQDYVEMSLWRDWAASAVADHVRQVVGTIKDLDQAHPVMLHRGACDVIADIAGDAGDDKLFASTGVDWYGTSCSIWLADGNMHEPKNMIDHAWGAMQMDWIRSVDTKYWCQEFYPCRAEGHRKPLVTLLARQVFIALAAGANGFTWWQYRSERLGNESNGYGLREIGGQPSERSELADQIAQVLSSRGAALKSTGVPAGQVGLYYSRSSDMTSRMAVWGDYLVHRTEPPKIDYPYKQAIYGAYLLNWANSVERDWVGPGEPLQGYRMVYVAGAEVVSEAEAQELKQYVSDGGTLVVECPFAFREENTWMTPRRPNYELDVLAGCRAMNTLNEGEASVQWPGIGPIAAAGVRCELEPTTGEVVARWEDGTAAVVEHRSGEGRVITSGIQLSCAYLKHHDQNALRAFHELCRTSGVEPLLSFEHAGKVVAHRRVNHATEVWFVFNLTSELQAVSLPANVGVTWWEGARLSGNRVELGAGGTWVGEMAGRTPRASG